MASDKEHSFPCGRQLIYGGPGAIILRLQLQWSEDCSDWKFRLNLCKQIWQHALRITESSGLDVETPHNGKECLDTVQLVVKALEILQGQSMVYLFLNLSICSQDRSYVPCQKHRIKLVPFTLIGLLLLLKTA